jgi:hypothetical protein
MMYRSAFPDGTPAHVPLHQHPAHAAALRAIGADARSVALGDGGHATVILRRFGPVRLALVPRGPVWPTPRAPAVDELHGLRRRLPRTCLLVVNGDRKLPASTRLLPLVTPQTMAEWDLRPPPPELRRALHQKWRNRLVRAEAQGQAVHHCAMPPDPCHWLLRCEALQARKRRYRTWPPALIAAHARLGTARLFVAGPAGAPLAAMLFIVTGARATYQAGWTSAAGRRSDAHRLLIWQAALALRDRGVTRLDLGVIDTDTAPGLARFKLGTGARAHRLGATALVL